MLVAKQSDPTVRGHLATGIGLTPLHHHDLIGTDPGLPANLVASLSRRLGHQIVTTQQEGQTLGGTVLACQPGAGHPLQGFIIEIQADTCLGREGLERLGQRASRDTEAFCGRDRLLRGLCLRRWGKAEQQCATDTGQNGQTCGHAQLVQGKAGNGLCQRGMGERRRMQQMGL